MFIVELFTMHKFPSVNEWIRKIPVELHNGILYSRQKKELLPFITAWMELQNVMLSEKSQAVKDKYHLISLISGT